MTDKELQRDRLHHLLNDRSLLRQKESFNTYQGRAVAEEALLHQGRFRQVTAASVVGATASYPRLPDSFACDPVGPEPLIDARDCGPVLGYEIDERVSTSAASEVRDVGVEVAPKSPTLVEASTPLTLSAEAEAERKAALADRMLQINAGKSATEANPPLEAAPNEPALLRASRSGAGSFRSIRRRI
jgi:hypothetical protein